MTSRLSSSARLVGLAGVIGLAALVGVALTRLPATAAPVDGTTIPAPRVHLRAPTASPHLAHAVLAGGCFWGMELVFSHVQGVTNVVAGYAGGDAAHANYADSSSGRYGDAEAVRIDFDPSRIRYGELLRIYFSVAHDPTERNRQGPDTGPQYRSEIFAANTDQARVAHSYIKQLDASHAFGRPIVTTVSIGRAFFPAEDYHQNYARLHPHSRYIRWDDLPKLRALKQRYPQRYTAHYAAGGPLAPTATAAPHPAPQHD